MVCSRFVYVAAVVIAGAVWYTHPQDVSESKEADEFFAFSATPKKGGICMKHLRSFFAVLLAAAVCAAVVLFSGCGASVQVQQLTIPGERGSIHATLTTPANAETCLPW